MNDEEYRVYQFPISDGKNVVEVTFEIPEEWFARRDINSDKNGYLYVSDDKDSGYLIQKFSVNNKSELSIYIEYWDNKAIANVVIYTQPEERNKGYGTYLAKRATEWLLNNSDGFDEIQWAARDENFASRHLAEKNGWVYVPEESAEGWHTYFLKIKDYRIINMWLDTIHIPKGVRVSESN